MSNRASYHEGFAPRDGRPLYPGYRNGLQVFLDFGLGPTGKLTRDWSGKANNGLSATGAMIVPVDGRYAAYFDGTAANLIDIGTNTSLDTGTLDFTLHAWIKPISYATSADYFSAGGGGVDFSLGQESTGRGRCQVYKSAYQWDLNPTTVMTVGSWWHLAVTRKGTEGVFYVNGMSNVTASGTLRDMTTASSKYVGGRAGGRWANGYLAEFALWHVALNPSQIKTLATRRGLMSELAPRRRASAATGNRRRRLLIGAH